MDAGDEFRFIVDENIAGRMDRVVMLHDGRIEKKEKGPEGISYLVGKT
ncbi:MAG: hypothetical protein GQ559_08440 [Desulfobulbaceae bacterium]|nr:hypothetical protein [Desulfobulbaceae bacterium]